MQFMKTFGRCTGYGPIISAAEELSEKYFINNDFLVKNNKYWAQKLNELKSYNIQEKENSKLDYFIPKNLTN